MRFDELNIPAQVLEGIRAAGFTDCTPVQALTIPDALQGKDIAAQAQTGTGKTAAFLVPVFSRMLELPHPGQGPSPRALIIAPTRELVVQIEAEARVLGGPAGFRILSVFGGIDYDKQRRELQNGVDILIGTPGRLIDYLKQKVYSLKKTQFLVIDEADRMFDMGFISDLRFLLRRMAPYNERQSFLFSATLSTRVMELSYEHMNAPEKFVVTPEQMTVEKIEQTLYHVGKEEKMGLLLGMLRHEGEGRYLIFCNMKVTVERVADTLTANGHPAAAIIGDLPQKKRLKVIEHFKDGTVPILVATDVASRGLHIDNVTHVINYDIPQDPEDYVHRIGRTGRAGSTGKAITFGCEDYVLTLPDIEAYIKESIPTAAVTDELVVTEFKRPPRRPRPDKKLHPDRQHRPDRRRTDHKPGDPSSGSGRPGSSRRRGNKPGSPAQS